MTSSRPSRHALISDQSLSGAATSSTSSLSRRQPVPPTANRRDCMLTQTYNNVGHRNDKNSQVSVESNFLNEMMNFERLKVNTLKRRPVRYLIALKYYCLLWIPSLYKFQSSHRTREKCEKMI